MWGCAVDMRDNAAGPGAAVGTVPQLIGIASLAGHQTQQWGRGRVGTQGHTNDPKA